MNAPPQENTQALPPGTRLEEFEILQVLGSGGFGITYLARDTSLGRQVVIKENLPVQFAIRDTHSLTVSPRHTVGEDAENFDWSLENFSKEAGMLASLDHPGIVKVLRSFLACGTAFFVMPFVEGFPFDEMIRSRAAKGNPFDAEEITGLLEHVLDALAYLHDRGIYHRDIKPGNILVTKAGVPVLIDFGSARQRLSERSMTVVESPGYTPFEQLQSRGNVGPWSDLYALGATVARAMTEQVLPKAMDRMRNDPFVPLEGREELRAAYPQALLATIDKALRVNEEERWQDAREWAGVLVASLDAHAASSLAGIPATVCSYPTRTPKESSFVNSLGMHFVPAGTKGVLFCTTETRVRDFETFVEVTGHDAISNNPFGAPAYTLERDGNKATWKQAGGSWRKPRFPQGLAQDGNHPVVCVSYLDAEAFCKWLTAHDKDLLPQEWVYRLPTDDEWSVACGPDEFPWGNQWPPPVASGNYCGEEAMIGAYEEFTNDLAKAGWSDRFARTAPVGSFAPNRYGLYDMGGNVWEFCSNWYQASMNSRDVLDAYPTLKDDKGGRTFRVLRGASWGSGTRVDLQSACRDNDEPRGRGVLYGFRCVVAASAS